MRVHIELGSGTIHQIEMLTFFIFLNEWMNNLSPFNNFQFPRFLWPPILFWHPSLLSIFGKSVSPPLKNWERLLWKGWKCFFFVRPIKRRNLAKCTWNSQKQELLLMLPLSYRIILGIRLRFSLYFIKLCITLSVYFL